jgi:hypothetical protein
VWTYREPFTAVAAIKDRLAFYPDRVDSIAEQEAVGVCASASPREGSNSGSCIRCCG